MYEIKIKERASGYVSQSRSLWSDLLCVFELDELQGPNLAVANSSSWQVSPETSLRNYFDVWNKIF